MATFANIVIKNGAPTPTDTTFAIKSNDLRVSRYEERSGGVPIGYGKLGITVVDVNKNNRRIDVALEIPVLEATSGANPAGFVPAATVAYYNKCTVSFVTNNRSVTQDRENILAYVRNALALPLISSIVVDGEEISG